MAKFRNVKFWYHVTIVRKNLRKSNAFLYKKTLVGFKGDDSREGDDMELYDSGTKSVIFQLHPLR